MDLNNNHMPKVSVIVPVYHSEAFLERCCRSLFGQSLDDIEYIFIIDGVSTDAEQIIQNTLASYPLHQGQVTILRHLENQGISYSRQEGHDQARGEFLFHCDSDDWLEADALLSAYELAIREKSDLVFFDYVRHYEDTGKEIIYSSSHVQQGFISTMDASLHNVFIRRQLLISQGLRFPKGINWGEDLYLSVLLQVLTKKIVYLPQVFYHYCMHSRSFTSEVDVEKYMQLVACPLYVEQELAKRHLSAQFTPMLLQMKYEVKEYFLLHPKMRNIDQWLGIYPECHSSIWQYSSVPFYLKCLSWMSVHHMTKVVEVLLCCRDLIHRCRRL